MSNANVEIFARISTDINISTNDKGEKVARFMAYKEIVWVDGNGKKQSKTKWYSLIAFGHMLEMVERYLSKGVRILVSGSNYNDVRKNEDGEIIETPSIKLSQITLHAGLV